MDNFNVFAYWWERKASADDCAVRITQFLSDLGRCDSQFNNWYWQGRSRKEGLRWRLSIVDRASLRRAVLRGRHRNYQGKLAFPELGFGLGMWNGLDSKHATSISLSCGAWYPDAANCCLLYLPDELGSLKRAGSMQDIIAAVVNAWNPDCASVVSNRALSRRRSKGKAPIVDWMVYVSNRWMPNPPQLEPPASSKKLPDGTLIVVQKEPTDVKNPEHLRNIRQVRNAIRPRLRIPASSNEAQSDT